MAKKSGRDTKHLATRDGVATTELERDDIAEDNSYRSIQHTVLDSCENALDLFPEEHPVQPVARAPAAVAAAPQSEVRRFAWPETDEESDEPRSPYYDVPGWSERVRQLVPVVIASVVFAGVIAGVAAWVLSDIREAGVVQNYHPSESAVPAPPIRPRPQPWGSTAPFEPKTSLDPEPLTPPPAPVAEPSVASAVPMPDPATPSPLALNEQRTGSASPPAPKVEAAPERKPGTPRIAPAATQAPTPPAFQAPRPPAPQAARPPASQTPRPPASEAPRPPVSQTVANAPPPRLDSASGTRAAPNLATTSPPLTVTNVPSVPVPDPSPIAPVEPVRTSPETVAPTPRPPASVAAAAAPAAPVVRRDEDDVRSVIGRYRTAYSELDAFAAREVWPTVDIKALSRAFDQLASQNVDFKTCSVSVGDARAVANCDGSMWYVPKVGGKGTRTDNRRWRFDLRKGNDGWTIDSVSSK